MTCILIISVGLRNPDTMVIIKKGYSNVHAKMNGANWNIIGKVKTSKDCDSKNTLFKPSTGPHGWFLF